MIFSYYKKLSPGMRKIYKQSDEISKIEIPEAHRLGRHVKQVERELADGRRVKLARALQTLNDDLLEHLAVAGVKIRVLSKRPSKSWGELQGLYEPEEDDSQARITVWMRTAQRHQVVAFKSFFRTYLHELVHHLDYELLELEDSLHTEGFYRRESSLFRQLVKGAGGGGARGKKPTPVKKAAKKAGQRRKATRSLSGRPGEQQAELPF